MTLELLLNIICDLGIKRNLVNYSAAGSSVYSLNTLTIDSYPVLFVSPTGSIVTRKNFTDYGLSLFFIERLLEDNANDTRTYSIANDTLVNLVRQLRQLTGIVEVSEPSVRLFNDERLNDRCCGAYAEITVTVLNDAECGLWFDEEGEFMGTYIPNTLKEVDILDSLASKDWVAKYVAEHSTGGASGMTEEEVRRLINNALRDYTKTNKFAKINGSGITDNEAYSLLTSEEFEAFLTGYTQEIQNIWNSMTSGGTPADYNQVKAQVTANTENIAILSAQTSANTAQIAELSGATSGINETIETINNTVTGINETVIAISAQTSGISQDLADLSGSTEQAVSSLTQDIETLYAAISAATPADYEQLKGQVTANTQNIEILSGLTSAITGEITTVEGQITAITGDFAAIEGQVTANTENIQILSGITSGIASDLTALSAFTETLTGNTYTLPTASASVKGGIQVGRGLSMSGDTMNADVASTDVHTIVSLTKSEYEQLATKDPTTLYVIKPLTT